MVCGAGGSEERDLSMVYAGFRYVLPTTAGSLLRVRRQLARQPQRIANRLEYRPLMVRS